MYSCHALIKVKYTMRLNIQMHNLHRRLSHDRAQHFGKISRQPSRLAMTHHIGPVSDGYVDRDAIDVHSDGDIILFTRVSILFEPCTRARNMPDSDLVLPRFQISDKALCCHPIRTLGPPH